MPASRGKPPVLRYLGAAGAAGLSHALFYLLLAGLAGAFALGHEDPLPSFLFAGCAIGLIAIYHAHWRRVQSQAQLIQELEDLSLATFERAPVGVVHVSPEGLWLRANLRLCEILGYEPEELVGRDFRDITHPDDIQSNSALMAQMAAGEQPWCKIEKRYLRKDGAVIWASLTSTMLYDRGGRPRYTVSVIEDITARRHADQQLHLAGKLFQRSGDGVMITDAQHCILTVNETFTSVTGFTAEDVIGKTPAILESGRHSRDFYRRMMQHLESDGWWQGEIWNKRKDGEIYPEWLAINVVRDAAGAISHYVAVYSDIASVRKSQQRVDYLAGHDELTALANHNLFQDRLSQAIARARRDGQPVAVLYIDLDNFKAVNRRWGREVGDRLLQEVAQRLSSVIREADTIARLDSDEFAVTLCGIETATAGIVCDRVGEALRAGFPIDGHKHSVTASIGVSLFPEDGQDDGALLKAADAALRRAKDRGKDQYQYFAEAGSLG